VEVQNHDNASIHSISREYFRTNTRSPEAHSFPNTTFHYSSFCWTFTFYRGKRGSSRYECLQDRKMSGTGDHVVTRVMPFCIGRVLQCSSRFLSCTKMKANCRIRSFSAIPFWTYARRPLTSGIILLWLPWKIQVEQSEFGNSAFHRSVNTLLSTQPAPH